MGMRRKLTMVLRDIEICPVCGTYNPWLITYSRHAGARLIRYAKCKRCGERAVILFRPPPPEKRT